MSIKDRLSRAMKANLNEVLDLVRDFEDQGGIRRYVEPIMEDLGFEDVGRHGSGSTKKAGKSLKEYYANLEVPFGSDLDTVKDSYRRLMRKYHPDKHSGDSEREALATHLSQELTQAYEAVEGYLKTGSY
jgi:DnaJ-domain-containing protein 1